MRNGPAVSQPRARFPARGRTRRRERRWDNELNRIELDRRMIEGPRRRRKPQSSVRRNRSSARIEKTGMKVASMANSKPISLQFAPFSMTAAHDAQEMGQRQKVSPTILRPVRHAVEREHEAGQQDRRQEEEEGQLHRLHLRAREGRERVAEQHHRQHEDEHAERAACARSPTNGTWNSSRAAVRITVTCTRRRRNRAAPCRA